jgi:hypothetical protein
MAEEVLSYQALNDVGDTEGGHIIVRTTGLDEIGVLSSAKKVGVYWGIEDTDKVINAIKKLSGVV